VTTAENRLNSEVIEVIVDGSGYLLWFLLINVVLLLFLGMHAITFPDSWLFGPFRQGVAGVPRLAFELSSVLFALAGCMVAARAWWLGRGWGWATCGVGMALTGAVGLVAVYWL
jgi:hypothetical protein